MECNLDVSCAIALAFEEADAAINGPGADATACKVDAAMDAE